MKKRAEKKTKTGHRRSFESITPPGTEHVLAAVTVLAVLVVTLETVASFARFTPLFQGLEIAIVTIFSLEYLTRVFAAEHRLRYIFSFFGLIDLIAIVPSLLGLTNLTFLKAARAVRIIRLLRMLRLAKFSQIKRRKNAAQSLYRINLEIYSLTLLITTLILGSLFYVFEGHTLAAKDIPSGMWWALSAILGGISYPQPETTGGLVTLILARFTSMILLGMLLGLIGTILRKILIGSEKDA